MFRLELHFVRLGRLQIKFDLRSFLIEKRIILNITTIRSSNFPFHTFIRLDLSAGLDGTMFFINIPDTCKSLDMLTWIVDDKKKKLCWTKSQQKNLFQSHFSTNYTNTKWCGWFSGQFNVHMFSPSNIYKILFSLKNLFFIVKIRSYHHFHQISYHSVELPSFWTCKRYTIISIFDWKN